MSNGDIIRAWKDEDYWHSLSEEMRSHLPENPAGIVELCDEEMELIVGGLIVIKGPIDSNNAIVCISGTGSFCKENFNSKEAGIIADIIEGHLEKLSKWFE